MLSLQPNKSNMADDTKKFIIWGAEDVQILMRVKLIWNSCLNQLPK